MPASGAVSDNGGKAVFGDLRRFSGACQFASLLTLPVAPFCTLGSSVFAVFYYTQRQTFARCPH
jgi:hypothetical protein